LQSTVEVEHHNYGKRHGKRLLEFRNDEDRSVPQKEQSQGMLLPMIARVILVFHSYYSFGYPLGNINIFGGN
jgi:hypothetical protein